MKKGWMICVAGVLAGGFLGATEKRPYSRYEPIVERAPFGKPPANFNPSVNPATVSARSGANGEKELSPEQEQLKKAVKFSALNLDPEGILRVGFSDMSSAKMPRHYYLAVGESRDGWTVLEANALERTVKLKKDGVELEMSLGSNEATGTANAAATPAPQAANTTAKSVADAKGGNLLLGRRRLLEQRKEKEEKRKAEQEAQKKKDEEERMKMREELAAIREEVRQAREKEEEGETVAPAAVQEAEEPPPPPPPPDEGADTEGAE